MKFALAMKGFELGIELLELVLNDLTSIILKPQESVIPKETNLKPWGSEHLAEYANNISTLKLNVTKSPQLQKTGK
jgi:hypothetical protein